MLRQVRCWVLVGWLVGCRSFFVLFFVFVFFPLEKNKKRKERKLKVQLADFMFLCHRCEKVLLGLAVPFHPFEHLPSPNPSSTQHITSP